LNSQIAIKRCIVFFTAICPVGVALEARHAGGTDATLSHAAKTSCLSLGNPEPIMFALPLD